MEIIMGIVLDGPPPNKPEPLPGMSVLQAEAPREPLISREISRTAVSGGGPDFR